MAASAEDLAAADTLVTDMSPSARRTYAVGRTQKYELPNIGGHPEPGVSQAKSGAWQRDLRWSW